jgi:hypothetical protein
LLDEHRIGVRAADIDPDPPHGKTGR